MIVYIIKNKLNEIDRIPNFVAIQKQQEMKYKKKLIEARKKRLMPLKPIYLILDIGIMNITIPTNRWWYSPEEHLNSINNYYLDLVKKTREAKNGKL